ncbi:MAG: peptide-N-glycosidase F-related protein [Crocinitomicaceae bacterium]|nr:peptide-N-glycosidase F-related protein [Crocinitomicaceae bacterium]
MKFRILIFAFLFSTPLFSQDTTWVQTFTFDSITTRRANFEFPQDLNNKRFEKVLMYYKLKCSPLTTWDQYNCGEWDYLTYTRVYNHTGLLDSVRVDGNQYLSNWDSPDTISIAPLPTPHYDYLYRKELVSSGASASTENINSSNTSGKYPFNTENNAGRFQMLISANELNTANISSGLLNSLTLYIDSIGANGELLYPSIAIKSTSDSVLLDFHQTGFTEVYNQSKNGANAFINGANELLFHTPYSWNGNDNLIVEFYFENENPNANSIVFNTENITSDNALYYEQKNGHLEFDGSNHVLLEFSDTLFNDEITIEFWAKGTGNTGTNTSLLEGYDTLNNRIINLHWPWNNNNFYFDAGEGSQYDRIYTGASTTEIDNQWNHWALVKKQSTGEMFIYKNGALWLSGTGKNKNVGYLHRLIIGANKNTSNHWKGKIDELRIYNSALSQTVISNYYKKQANSSHPNWANLMNYYDFDNAPYMIDKSSNDFKAMPSSYGMIQFNEYPLAGVSNPLKRPQIGFGYGGTISQSGADTLYTPLLKEPLIVFEQQTVNYHFEIINSWRGYENGTENTYDSAGQIINTSPINASTNLFNNQITHYYTPFEIIEDIEIARYITPYGIQFDLGPNGFAWIYDVTDYQHYLKDTVDLRAHNTQELLDLKFAFIEGIPPRDIHKREAIWDDFRSYSFNNMANDIDLSAKNVLLSDTSNNFKIKTRMTGHGHQGNNNCCEWVSNNHQIKVDGVSRFNWNIWQPTECGDNPNISQGGTWPYAREGWCPGDKVKEYEFELTPYVTPGDSVSIDYSINDVPTSDPGQGSGNYIAAFDLISYSAPNFQNDAAITDILNPNNWEYYSKFNPTCSNPRVLLRNTGAQNLVSCKIRCWITYGNFLEYEWSGNLAFLEETVVEIPVTDPNFWKDLDSNNLFTAQVYQVNGTFGNDEYLENSVKTSKFDNPEFIDGPFYVWLTTNNKANENEYRLIDEAGNVIFERTQLDNNTQYKDTFDLAPGCYSIIITDNDNDGLSFWYSAQVEGETAGTMRIRKVGGGFIEFFPGDFGNYHRYNFSVGFALEVDEKDLDHEINIFPNPTKQNCTIEVSGSVYNNAHLTIYDLMGKELLSQKMNSSQFFAETNINMSDFKSGTYIVKIITNERTYTKELIKN